MTLLETAGLPDITSREFKADPFPFYALARATAPVCRVSMPGRRHAWLVTRYDDAIATLRDERFIKNKRNAMTADQAAKQPWAPGIMDALARNMLDVDGVDHTRLRRLVQRAFTPRRIAELRDRIQSTTDALLADIPRDRSFDLVQALALPLPTTVIAELLGIPPQDRNRFHHWSSSLLGATSSRWGPLRTAPTLFAFVRYVRSLIRERRANPSEDLISALVEAEESGDQLDADELVAMVFILLVAGHETTVNLIGNGTLALTQHPEQMGMLREDPALVQTAIEELLRYAGPLDTATERYPREDVEFEAATIPRGSLVFVALASANRDDHAFERPDALDLTRDPNPHLAFGLGAHHCLGAPLARLEAQIAFSSLLERAPLALDAPAASLRWRRGMVLRGLETLPVRYV